MIRRRTVASIEELRKLIKLELVMQGLKQRDLCEYLGFSDKHVSRLLTGKANISLANLFEICAYLGLSVTIDPSAE
jgi:transcriptional regulator with XRE-family HTH domain